MSLGNSNRCGLRWQDIYRLCIKGSFNAFCHSGAKRIDLELEYTDCNLTVPTHGSPQVVITNLTGHPSVILPNGLRGADAPEYPFEDISIRKPESRS